MNIVLFGAPSGSAQAERIASVHGAPITGEMRDSSFRVMWVQGQEKLLIEEN